MFNKYKYSKISKSAKKFSRKSYNPNFVMIDKRFACKFAQFCLLFENYKYPRTYENSLPIQEIRSDSFLVIDNQTGDVYEYDKSMQIN